MTTLREQIVDGLGNALVGFTNAGGNVFRSREVAITRGITPALIVVPDGESSQRMGQFTDRHVLNVKLSVFVRGDPWDQAADVVAAQAHRVIFASAALRALATDIRKVSTDYEAEEADRTAGTLSARYEFTYLSRADDIAAAP